MLKSLLINNYALIRKLDISFSEGFTVMTGETGAGKSIILGALNLLLGQRADTNSIRTGHDRCIIEGSFNISDYDLESFFSDNNLEYYPNDTLLRREIISSGKSRAFINDTPVTLPRLKELGENLVDIHSQHQNILLKTDRFKIMVVDSIAKNNEQLALYRTYLHKFRELKAKIESLHLETRFADNDRDYLCFQLEQIENAGLDPNEQESLEEESDMLSHAEQIKSDLYTTLNALDGEEINALSRLKLALQSLRNAAKNYSSANTLAERVESCLIELKDILNETERAQDSIKFDPLRLDEILKRLDTIYSLQKKHQVNSVQELIDFAKSIREKLLAIDGIKEEIVLLESQLLSVEKEMIDQAIVLSDSRIKTAKQIEEGVINLLIALGLPNANFKINILRKKEFDSFGCDNVSFMFSANKNSELRELQSVASGGELSRVMLSLKSLIMESKSLPTIIFDEIDTGVSGAVAEKMALIMKDMCKSGHQVITITHLPQIASKGKNHFKVYKEESSNESLTYITELTYDERIMEIAKLMSGSTLSNAAIDNAKVLLGNL